MARSNEVNVVELRPAIPPPPEARSEAERPAPSPRRRLPKAPDWLSPTGKATFRTMAEAAEEIQPGWLTSVDVPLLALYADVYATAQAASKAMRGAGGHVRPIDHDRAHAGRPRKHPSWQIVREASTTLARLAGDLGITPTMRRRLDLDGIYVDAGDSDDVDADADLFD